jgi:potassium-dependent mechanosensitive channel
MHAKIQIQHESQRENYTPPARDIRNVTKEPFPLFKYSVTKSYLIHLMGLALALMVVFNLPYTSYAQEESPTLALQQIGSSIEKALVNHRVELSALKVRLEQMESLESNVGNFIQAYDSQNTAYSRLLLMSQPQIASLELARKNNALALNALMEQYETIRKQHEASSILLKQTTESIELAQKQLAEMQESSLPVTQKEELETAIRELVQVLEEKKQLGDRYIQIHDDLMRELMAAIDEKTALGEKIAARLDTRIKESIFTQTNFYRGIGKTLPAALSSLGSRLSAVFSPLTWQSLWGRIKIGGLSRCAIFGFWLVLILSLQARLRGILQRIEDGCVAPNQFYRGLGIFLLRRSLLLLGMTLLSGVYSSLELRLLDIGLGRALFPFFLTLLLTRWGLDYLDHGLKGPSTALRSFVSVQINQLFKSLRVLFIFGIILVWAAGVDSLLNRLSADLLAVGLLIWTVIFWRRIRPVLAEGVRKGEAVPEPLRTAMVRGWSYVVSGGSLLLSIAGYNLLSGKWISAWIVTVALLFLGWISLNALREWHRDLRDRATDGDDSHLLDSAHQLRLSMVLILEIVWFFCMARGLVWAWDYSNLLAVRVRELFYATIKISSLSFSLKGILTAIMILFLTHILVRVGCSYLREMVLDKKPLERGFKDSILTVTRYLGWGIGLLLVLGTIGVDTTSLAVVFGALSVGIGFGLQTIFNNFISGLILLFERPIQVGDIVEINGMWAEVKKINVRATVVQTFDNASVIIPNSEFISQQVTNWSFKDSRMRRSLEVGVAYGSDIDLVEKTLSEIARKNQNVLKYPKPDVLFIDHAASALIFRLRLWVNVDNYWSVPHNIRREIDRQFRELHIEIAFPQQDVHLRTIPKKMMSAASSDSSVKDVSINEPTTRE